MTKLVLDEITNPENVAAINNNFQRISTYIQDKSLSRDTGVAEPNQMEVDLDLNSGDILNAGTVSANSFIWRDPDVTPTFVTPLTLTDHNGEDHHVTELTISDDFNVGKLGETTTVSLNRVFKDTLMTLADIVNGLVKPSPTEKVVREVIELPKVLATFGQNTPSDLTGASQSNTGRVALVKHVSVPRRLHVVVLNDSNEADKVRGISLNGSPIAYWEYKDIVIDGHKYRAFCSAVEIREKHVGVFVDFGGV
jgi:hypothetical protein